MKELRAKRTKMLKEGTLIVTVDIDVASNPGYRTTLDRRATQSFRFDNTREGFDRFWCITIASKNRFGCDCMKVEFSKITSRK